MPHRDEPGLAQFVTFRLEDSFPRELRSEWEHILQIEGSRERRSQLEAYLDRGRGGCFLRLPQIAGIVEESLRYFHGERYDLRAWVIMPNHVHVLFNVGETPMKNVLETWKKHTAQKANRFLNRRGKFWQEYYWDTYMRDTEHELKTRKYIEGNPVKAKLVLDPKTWPFCSARFRENVGILKPWEAVSCCG